jgi:hypothetical protein
LFGIFAGLVSLLKPVRFLGIRSRKRGLATAGLGFLIFVAAVYLPVGETRVESARTLLDEYVPVFQFHESHSIAIHASRERVDAAIRAVTPEEIRFYQTLTWMRGISPSLAAARRPILGSFTAGWFKLLADHPGQEFVFGHAGDARGCGESWRAEEFKTYRGSPQIKIAMNFHIEELDATHCVLRTETRVYAQGARVQRGFATYWRMIYPGSSLIRYMWLRAIRQRAETTR